MNFEEFEELYKFYFKLKNNHDENRVIYKL